MNAVEKIILLLCLLVSGVCNVSAFTSRASENCVWENFSAAQQSRLVETSQVVGTHQQNASVAYDTASESLLAAETTVARNPNVYEALFESPISGTSRAAHRASANDFLATQLRNDSQLSGMFNQELGGNVLQHMESGSSGLLNPPGTVWHHPFDNPNVMQLLRTSEHTAPSLQPVLHPGGVGGFGNFYGP